MSRPDSSEPASELAFGLAEQTTLGDTVIPALVYELAGRDEVELAWRNELGGLTFRLGERFVKWNPRSSGLDLDRERVRLEWLAGRHPAPLVIDAGGDGSAQWMVTAALPGEHVVAERWLREPAAALEAMAAGLRALHSVAIDDFPAEWTAQTWVGRLPDGIGPRPECAEPVLLHGDACAPNTLISPDGEWTGNVDFGSLSVGDRWADLAIASLSLDWNYGPGHQPAVFEAYGVEPDEQRIRYYRRLWSHGP